MIATIWILCEMSRWYDRETPNRQYLQWPISLWVTGIYHAGFSRSRINAHYSDVIMDTMVSQIASLMIVYSTVNSSADQRTHQSAASLAFVRGIHRWPVNSPQKGPVTRKMFPFDDVIMISYHTWNAHRILISYAAIFHVSLIILWWCDYTRTIHWW